jgi:uncharacterized membrane protein YidH (DUF202 family)
MPPPEPSPGVARERTGLAWERSALAYATLGAVVLGVAAHRHAPGLLPVSAALAIVAFGVWLHGRRAYERTAVAPQPRTLGLMSVATGLAAVAAVIAVIARL